VTDITVQIGSQIFSDWNSVRVKASVQQLAGEFSLGCSGNWSLARSPKSLAGQPVRISVAGQRVLTGYIDAAKPEYDAERHLVRLDGRSKTEDLVDCSLIAPPLGWANLTVGQIATAMCKPFHIDVVDQTVSQQSFTMFSPNDGESCFDALEPLARNVGMLLITDAFGRLVLTYAGKQQAPTALVKGKNIIHAIGGVDLHDRFSHYLATGQAPENPDLTKDQPFPGLVIDPYMAALRYRPRWVQIGGVTTLNLPTIRADWERRMRYGRSESITYTVKGWLASKSAIWQPNQLVNVNDPFMGISGQQLITDVVYTYSDDPETGGEHCEITVMPPDALAPEPQPLTPSDTTGSVP
jgi:prophage tail gpP-like protein